MIKTQILCFVLTCWPWVYGQVYPPLWDQAPNTLADYPLIDDKTTIDPWNYLHRMGMYKIMLQVTQPDMTQFGSDNTGNVLWGLPIQHGWQFQSGRLQSFTDIPAQCQFADTVQNICISTTSWWASINYYLSVVPFIAAEEAGYLSDWPHPIEILPPSDGDCHLAVGDGEPSCMPERVNKFCRDLAGCSHFTPKAMEAWVNFFKYTHNSHGQQAQEVAEESLPVADGRGTQLDQVLKYMWNAHIHSINEAIPQFVDVLDYMSAPEVEFGTGWGKYVDFIGLARIHTNYNMITRSLVIFPSRVLQEADLPPNIQDLTPVQNGFLHMINTFQKLLNLSDGKLLQLWKQWTCSDSGREKGRRILFLAGRDPLQAISAFLDLVGDNTVYSCEDH